jgi:DNA mismatch endonuclease Vsr
VTGIRTIKIAGAEHAVVIDPSTSARLAGVRRERTAPEQHVRVVLRALGMRCTTSNRDLAGSPDFANRTRRWAVFVHGCFWHHHRGCRKATVPKRNRDFWLAKFDDNRKRDQRAIRALRRLDYSVAVIWECETTDANRVARRLRRLREQGGDR